MQYLVDNELYKFDAWSGGKTHLDNLINHPDAYNYISNMIEEADFYGDDRIRTETELNDYLWFYMYDDLVEAGYMTTDHEWIKDDEEKEDEDDQAVCWRLCYLY